MFIVALMFVGDRGRTAKAAVVLRLGHENNRSGRLPLVHFHES